MAVRHNGLVAFAMSILHDPMERTGYRWLFYGPSGASRQGVRQWWGQRRWRYNRDLFLIGVVSWVLVLVAGSAAVNVGEDFEEPLMMIFGPVFCIGLANAAYTAGPIFDTMFFIGTPRRGAFKAGYIFSLVLTALPGTMALVAWLTTVVTGQTM
jgi:hypothetical protein